MTEQRTARQRALIAKWRAEAEARTERKRSRLAAERLPENVEARASRQRVVQVLDLMGADYVLDTDWSPDDVEWTPTQHRVLVNVPNRPSLVRRGERPRVKRPMKVAGDPAEMLAQAKARLNTKGLVRGRSRTLLRAKVARLQALVDMQAPPKRKRPRLWVPPTFPAAPVVRHEIRQSDYYGWCGMERAAVPVPERRVQALPFGRPCLWDGVSA